MTPSPSPQPQPHVVALDYGMKWNIPRHLVDQGCRVTVLPGTATAEEVLAHKPDGVFLSNGPGDPEPLEYAISTIRGLLGKKPIFGICLGHQLLGLACGAKTFKLKFGHRGANQPVQNLETGRVEITSQNHGFAVDRRFTAQLRARSRTATSTTAPSKASATRRAGLQRAVPPRSLRRPARQPLSVPQFPGIDGRTPDIVAEVATASELRFLRTPATQTRRHRDLLPPSSEMISIAAKTLCGG